ncbi:tryptophan halogenase family protein [Pelomonas aquatica]|jgi:tryptophan halogenase|uniref:Tryptophan 7-halogenase n=1 Tax=Pelomonas aquatica TaxID=431058 RepID=A0A9X4LQ68_9BURK|nr:tryptophan halogenase family protein [Pelomonas aquatica]MCY4757171.1 tryptophan 7-halogenase [Pelomonas aquatica]MDG0865150.1 tryptophan 7-halogenase [Pelomonas aquatica]
MDDWGRPLQKVVIVGGGAAGWMSAAALSAVLKPPYEIRLVESDEIGIIGVGEATIPPIRLFNSLARIDEADFLKATQGSFKLGIEFVDWGRRGERYFHGFGSVGREKLWPVDFSQYWLRMRALGRALPLDAYAICNSAARAGRFMLPRPEMQNSPLNAINYAYHFDASLYAQALRRLSEARGVRRTEGKVVNALLHEQAGPRQGQVRAVQMQGGELIEGDLFLDCSGFQALLIEKALATGHEDWSHWLPCDRAVAVPSEPAGPLLPYTRATAHRAGWQWRIPLQHRVGNGHVYASGHVSDDEAADLLLRHLDGRPLAEPRIIRFRTGMRRQAWSRNVVAIGLAAGFVEPLESTALHLIQMGIGDLIERFPHAGFDALEIAEYNQRSRARYESVRDFVMLHYHLNQRDDSPFWRACAAMDIPAPLRRRMRLYESSGRLVYGDGDEFREASWLEVMEGQNLRPRAWLPLAELQGADDTAAYLKGISDTIAQCVAAMPSHEEFVRHYCAAARR